MADWHIIPNWQDHQVEPTCWCNPARFVIHEDNGGEGWRHRLANDGPSVIKPDEDPALLSDGRRWLIVEAA